jgi:hypothetical protein
MRLLVLENNSSFEINEIPDEVDDIRFCVLDNSDAKNPDYFFIPLIFLESFNAPALVLRIGDSVIKMPIDWQLLIGESEVGDLEVVPLTSINDRGFSAFAFNPLSSFRPTFLPVEVIDIYQDVKWYFPKLKSGQLLAVPLETNVKGSLCAYFVKDISRQCEIVNYTKAW